MRELPELGATSFLAYEFRGRNLKPCVEGSGKVLKIREKEICEFVN